MDRNQLTRELKVGLLVAMGLLFTLLTITFLGADKKLFAARYKVIAHFSQVQGLGPGSMIQLLGIRVGIVDKIEIVELEGKAHLRVVMDLESKFQKDITEGSVAGFRTQGALGDKFVYITPGPLGGKPIQDGETIKTEPSTGFFEALSENSGRIEDFFEILHETKTLLKSLNGNGKSAALMENLVTTSENLREMSYSGKLLLHDLRGGKDQNKLSNAVDRLSSIMTKIDSGTGTLGALVNDSSVYEGLKQIVGNNPKNKAFKNLIRDTIQSSEK